MNIIDFKDMPATDPNIPPNDVDWSKNSKASTIFVAAVARLMGEGITVVELGTARARNTCFMLSQIQNIGSMYTVDFYLPCEDEFERPDNPARVQTQRTQDASRHITLSRISSLKEKDKCKLILEHTSKAVEYFEDHSIDFLWIDNYLNGEDVARELRTWYNKVRDGGYIAGHDWVYSPVREEVFAFRYYYDIQSPMSAYGADWIWKKDGDI